ncbi:MAG: glycosyltransferase family 2 protein [Candidatus Diapherotrites archaeon]|nr:glycosyltransferase family 2 protein [Candidatus Diapherotrites archaeon]
MEKNKTIIIIPAYNEEENIGRTIRIIKENTKNIEIDNIKVDSEIIVVNDGSTDKTAEIARNKGCEVINLPRNLGKANAFFAGIKAAIRKDADVVITMDADLLEAHKEDFIDLIKAARDVKNKNKPMMVIAQAREKVDLNMYVATISNSGIRAFNKPACYVITSAREKGKVKGYGIENYLNILFAKNQRVAYCDLKFKEAYRGNAKNKIIQKRDIRKTLNKIKKLRRIF